MLFEPPEELQEEIRSVAKSKPIETVRAMAHFTRVMLANEKSWDHRNAAVVLTFSVATS